MISYNHQHYLQFQATAFAALKARQLRLFHDAITDDRFKRDHLYDTSDGFPKSLLSLAIDQWEGQSDTSFITLLLSAGFSLDDVDQVTEVAPIHAIIKQGNTDLARNSLKTSNSNWDVNVQDGEGLTPLHTAVELLQVGKDWIDWLKVCGPGFYDRSRFSYRFFSVHAFSRFFTAQGLELDETF